MSYMNKKTLDVILEEYSNFGYRLKFTKVVEECETHPVTGKPTICKDVTTILPVDTLSFSASISDTLEDNKTILDTFTISMLAAKDGIVEMYLSKEQVTALATKRSVKGSAKDSRLRHIGFYDLISYDAATDVTTRVMEGRIYISDGVTS